MEQAIRHCVRGCRHHAVRRFVCPVVSGKGNHHRRRLSTGRGRRRRCARPCDRAFQAARAAGDCRESRRRRRHDRSQLGHEGRAGRAHVADGRDGGNRFQSAHAGQGKHVQPGPAADSGCDGGPVSVPVCHQPVIPCAFGQRDHRDGAPESRSIHVRVRRARLRPAHRHGDVHTDGGHQAAPHSVQGCIAGAQRRPGQPGFDDFGGVPAGDRSRQCRKAECDRCHLQAADERGAVDSDVG